MAYQIRCRKCEAETWAGNLRDLIGQHTDRRGRLICGGCGRTDTYIGQITWRWEQERRATWAEYLHEIAGRPASRPFSS